MGVSILKPGATILFQGDSITDGLRSRNEDLNHVLGHGYVYLIAACLGCRHPELGLSFLNRGISGNRVVDLYARWKEDALNLAPDVISILVGVNDVFHGFRRNAGVSAEQYERVYRMMLEDTRAALPEVSIILVEPFVLPVGGVKERWEEWQQEMGLRREVVARLAGEFDAVHVRTQDAFDAVARSHDPKSWLWDGIHPMPAGHQLLADRWLAAAATASAAS